MEKCAMFQVNYVLQIIILILRLQETNSKQGIVGDWKKTMTVAQSKKFDRVFKERMEKLPFEFCWAIQEDPKPISSSVEENNV
ncbi:SULT3A1: Sulfotransferase [Crotalus adamanteus]|uniref:Sulfotransferase n=1 Tax=Crotalus adamanteus TaxID=8729 RepID=A0AAW1CC99_CROAD